MVRLGKTLKSGEAFNVSAILEIIRGIGCGNYIMARVVFWFLTIVWPSSVSPNGSPSSAG
jgi:hypothetical protein